MSRGVEVARIVYTEFGRLLIEAGSAHNTSVRRVLCVAELLSLMVLSSSRLLFRVKNSASCLEDSLQPEQALALMFRRA